MKLIKFIFIFLTTSFFSLQAYAGWFAGSYTGETPDEVVSKVMAVWHATYPHKESCYAKLVGGDENVKEYQITGGECGGGLTVRFDGKSPPPTDKCSSLQGRPAGDLYSKMAGARQGNPSSPVNDPKVYDKDAVVKQRQTMNYPSCVEGCSTKASSPPLKKDGSWTHGFVNDPNLYVLVPSSHTGQPCTPEAKPPTSETNVPSPSSNAPQSQNDCPASTTFGSVNDVPMCVKNAPTLNASGIPQTSPADGKACASNCDKWDIEKPDTSNGKEGTGTGVDGDGQQGPSKEGGGTADKEMDTKDEDGNPIKVNNAGFGKINQDEIYKSQYKNKSFGAIWSDKSPELMQTPFIKSLSTSFPSFGGGAGAAPKLTLNFSAFKLGTHEVPIDPRIWMLIQAIMIITATFTARKIIWG